MNVETPWRPTRAEIDLDRIRHNVGLFVKMVGPACEVMAVVKADGYGHGAVETARAALEAGATRLGVALVEEGEELREAGLQAPVHLLFEPPPEAADRVAELSLVPTVYSRPYARELSRAAASRGSSLPVHLKVDTGMHRVGVNPEEALSLAEEVSALPGLVLEGAYTHLAMATEPDHPFNLRQWEEFRRTLERLERQPEEAIFIDDFAQNVAGARAVGMFAVQYTPDLDVAAALAAHGLNLNR